MPPTSKRQNYSVSKEQRAYTALKNLKQKVLKQWLPFWTNGGHNHESGVGSFAVVATERVFCSELGYSRRCEFVPTQVCSAKLGIRHAIFEPSITLVGRRFFLSVADTLPYQRF
jgi:hypothetical protein